MVLNAKKETPEYGTFNESEELPIESQGVYPPMLSWTTFKNRPLGYAFLFALVVLFIFLTCFNGVNLKVRKTSIIIDAGSSHTHFTLFSWKEVEHVESIGQCIVDQGISTISLESVPEHLEVCLTNISKVKGVLPRRTRVFLGATAGMRHLSSERRDSVMTVIRSSLQSSGFDFRNSDDAIVLSGEEEGLYDWIAINYLADDNEAKIGVMDMGGASCQLSYECGPSNACIDKSVGIYFKNKDRNLFSQSEPCYGINSGHKRYLMDLIFKAFVKSRPLNEDIEDPCISVSIQWAKSYLEDNQCSTIRNSTFQNLYLNLPSNYSFTFIPSETTDVPCSVDSLFKDCIFDNCFSTYPPLPSHIHHYVGEASLYWEYYKVLDGKTKFQNIESNMKQKCLDQKNPGAHPSDCFKIHFIHSMLKDGYHFSKEEHLQFLDVFKNITANWSLGFLIAKHPEFVDIFRQK